MKNNNVCLGTMLNPVQATMLHCTVLLVCDTLPVENAEESLGCKAGRVRVLSKRLRA